MSRQCYLCNGVAFSKRPGTVRDDPSLEILECEQCSLVFLSSHEHANEAHYRESGMHGGEPVSIEEWLRETARDDDRRLDYLADRIRNTSVLDFGCGAGGFLSKAESICTRVAGIEVEDAVHESYRERDIDVFRNLKAAKDYDFRYDYVTAFHVIEHLNNPISVLRSLAGLLEPDGEIIVEVPSSMDILLMLYNCKKFQSFTYWSQHLFLFNKKTLEQLAIKAGLSVIWMHGVQRYPISNHLYWLAKGEPGGHKKWSFLDSKELEVAYAAALSRLDMTDTLIAGFKKMR